MIHEAIDTVITLGWALLAWVAVLAAVGTVVLLTGLALGTWAVKRAWRAVRGPCGASDGSEAAPDAGEALDPADGRTAPQWAHDEQEAA